jgi:hypothetical protein
MFKCEGPVYYAAAGDLKKNMLEGYSRIEKNVASKGYRCNNAQFGDPIYGKVKQCWCDKYNIVQRQAHV